MVRLEGREPKLNARFIVTNLKGKPQRIYERIYCTRGEVENRIKELFDVALDRTSCEQVRQAVPHLALLPLIDERGGEPRDQTEPAIRSFEQHRAAVRTGVRNVEAGGQRPVEQLRKQNTRCRDRVAHAKASFHGESSLNKRFLSRGGLRVLYDSRIIQARAAVIPGAAKVRRTRAGARRR